MRRTKYAALPYVGVTDVYPVGVLQSLQIIGRALTVKEIPHAKRLPIVRREIRKTRRYLWTQAREGDWNAVRNSFNGYLAEPYTFPGYMRRCGHGWTTERAIRDLLRHEAECRANTSAGAA